MPGGGGCGEPGGPGLCVVVVVSLLHCVVLGVCLLLGCRKPQGTALGQSLRSRGIYMQMSLGIWGPEEVAWEPTQPGAPDWEMPSFALSWGPECPPLWATDPQGSG